MKITRNFPGTILLLALLFALVVVQPVFAQDTNPPEINGDQVVIGNAFRLLENQTLNGDLAVMGGTATLEANSTVNGNVAVMGGTLQIDGTVNGDVVAVGGQVSLSDNAVINGDVIVPIAMLNKAENATVTGQIITQPGSSTWEDIPELNEETPTPSVPSGRSFLLQRGLDVLSRFLWGMLATAALAALGLLFVLLFPKPIDRVSATISTQPVLSGAVGLLTLFLTPLVLILLIITIILLPFSLLAVILLVIALVVGWIGLGVEIGNRLEAMFHATWAVGVKALLGVGLITFITAIFNLLWFCGALVGFILAVVGLGAVVLTRFGFKDYPPAPVFVTAPMPVTPPTPAAPQAPDQPQPPTPEKPGQL